MNIRLKKDDKPYINTVHDLYIIMQAILKRENRVDRNREHLWTISLSNANKILNIELVSMGSVKQTVVEPMEVFSIPLQKRAVKIIVIHNHPSGRLIPSTADKDITDRLIQCGVMLDVPVLDHLIITEEAYYSFNENGLMEELKESTKYVPPFILKERLERQVAKAAAESKIKGIKEGTRTGKAEGRKEGAIRKALAMAASMKKNGEPVKKIMEYTGLTKKVIEGL